MFKRLFLLRYSLFFTTPYLRIKTSKSNNKLDWDSEGCVL